ncbi:MAG: class I SAM-dependent methyltransferase [Balneolaceae bacterium]|nr:MAG: class I SAM-dependent methyltransferase [Balneolaceae bacterium]
MEKMTDYFIEFFKKLDRQGPGDDKYTELAYRLLEHLPNNPQILDVGCGTGGQSLTLARISPCTITAVDVYDTFLKKLDERAKKETLKGTITTFNASMFELPFDEKIYDVIWSEVSICIMGFERGLKEWKRLLKPGGYLVASEITWLERDIPEEIRDYWNTAYPEIGTITGKITVIEECGYQPLAFLTLPEYGWQRNYYDQMEVQKQNFLKLYGNEEEACRIVKNELEVEANLYKTYKNYYSYILYIMRKL